MRRSFALALASLTLGVGSLALAAPGCGSSSLGVQDLCGWIGDECNCYRRFAAGVADVTPDTVNNVSVPQQPKCGVQLNDNKQGIDPTTGQPYAQENQKPTFGAFLQRDKLDICILTGPNGGQIVFDPPLDPTAFPPTGFTFKILDGQGEVCGTGSYTSTTSFSIGFPEPMAAAGGSGGGGGAGGAGGSTAGAQCRSGDNGAQDPETEAIAYGTFTMAGTDTEGVITTECPDGEAHKFNLFQLNKCDGSNGSENYKGILPTAEVDAVAGGIAPVEGEVRLRVFWPPTDPVDSVSGAKPVAVEYFHCKFPGAVHPCEDGEKNGAETDVDCGKTACDIGCLDTQGCLTGEDCVSGLCSPNAKGIKKCVGTPCGDGQKLGTETCDDGNTQNGDGCSSTCSTEPGFTCMGVGAGSCVDIDECTTTTVTCDVNAACKNTPGSFECKCNAGFSGDGKTCVADCGNGTLVGPSEACDDGNIMNGDGCSENCAVETGFTCMGQGPGSCVDVNECTAMTDTCSDLETCMNTVGSFTCTCDAPNLSCSGVCTETQVNLNNCGACGNVCKPMEICTSGLCCAAPNNKVCGGVCVDTQTDEANCNDCGIACPGGQTCTAGACM